MFFSFMNTKDIVGQFETFWLIVVKYVILQFLFYVMAFSLIVLCPDHFWLTTNPKLRNNRLEIISCQGNVF